MWLNQTGLLSDIMEASHRFELRTIVYKTIIITNLTTRPYKKSHDKGHGNPAQEIV